MAETSHSDGPQPDGSPENPELDLPREGQATGEHHEVTPEEAKARNRRNLAIAFGVVAFIVIVYSTTILRLAQNTGGLQ